MKKIEKFLISDFFIRLKNLDVKAFLHLLIEKGFCLENFTNKLKCSRHNALV